MKPLKETISRSDMETWSKGDPSWLRDRRQEAWSAWEKNAGSAKASGSRFLKSIQSSASWEMPAGVGGTGPAMEAAWGDLSGEGSFSRDGRAEFMLCSEARRFGVRFLPLSQAANDFPEEVRSLLFSLVPAVEGSFSALNAACFQAGTFLYVPKGVELKIPFKVKATSLEGVIFPRTLIWMGEGSRAMLVEEAKSSGEAAGFCSSVVEISLQSGAQLSYVFLQDLNKGSRFVQRQRASLGKDAALFSLSVARGSSASSVTMDCVLEGSGASADLLGLALPREGQEMEIRTLQRHLGRAGVSDCLVKSILRGASRFCFDGAVEIGREGAQAMASQSNPNLMLSDQARVETIPTLEIKCEDVSCKHAASAGTLDDQERFYLASRGVPESDAENLLVEGFAVDLAQRLPGEDFQEKLGETLVKMCRG